MVAVEERPLHRQGGPLKGYYSLLGSNMDASSIQAFEEHASEYDTWYIEHPSIFESEARAIEAFGLRGLGLDVGVGSGVFARRLGVSIGVDPSSNMLLIAKSRGIEGVRAVGEYLPFQGGIFDYVLMVSTLCFLDEPTAAIKEAHRALKINGYFSLCEVPRDSSWGRFIMEKGRAAHRFYRHARLFTATAMHHILEDCGFTVLTVNGTLRFNPGDEEKVEEPESDIGNKGFICLRATKSEVPMSRR